MTDRYAEGSSGPGVDAKGNPVIDPTRNVLDLVSAAIRRQDDLREMATQHTLDMQELRARYDEKLRAAESSRIDAIRAVDIGNVQRAAEVAAAQAEALRNQVAAAAAAGVTSLAAALDPIQKDIADLRRAQYEAQGKTAQVVEQRAGLSTTTAIIVAVVGVLAFFITLASLGLALYLAMHK